ncbi:YciI family protein [Microbacterium lacticum]
MTFDRLQRPETPAPVDDDTVHEWVLDIAYTGPAEEIAQLRESHVRWVRQHVGTGEFLAAGARVPGPGGVIVTNGLTQDRVQELIAEDPWSSAGLVRYEARAFTNGYRSPGLFSLREGEVALVNVAPTSAIEPSVDALTRVVEHVARTADGFGGARLLASTDGDTVINLAHWRSVEDFQAIFDDPEFRRLYDGFAQVIESSRYRLYRTERIIPPGT